MDSNQSTPPPAYIAPSATPGMFGTRIPSSVAFVVGILLFLLPFSEIRCGTTPLMNKSGLNFALGKDWKTVKSVNPFGNDDLSKKSMGDNGKGEGNSQYFAIAALGLAILGLLLTFGNAKAGGGGLVLGVLSAGALVALMVDLKKNFNDSLHHQALGKAQEGTDNLGMENIGNTMNLMKPTLHFTPWFYIAIVAFLAAAFFCYKRMSSSKT